MKIAREICGFFDIFFDLFCRAAAYSAVLPRAQNIACKSRPAARLARLPARTNRINLFRGACKYRRCLQILYSHKQAAASSPVTSSQTGNIVLINNTKRAAFIRQFEHRLSMTALFAGCNPSLAANAPSIAAVRSADSNSKIATTVAAKYPSDANCSNAPVAAS